MPVRTTGVALRNTAERWSGRSSLGLACAALLLLVSALSACGGTQAPPRRSRQEDAIYHYRQSLLQLDQRRYKESLEELGEAVRLDPENPLFRYQYGVVHFAMGEWDNAETKLREALELDPRYADAHNLLGAVLSEEGDREGALAEFHKVLADRTYPTPARVWVNIALLYEQMGNPEEAVTAYRKALDAEPGYGRAHYGLAQALEQSGQMDEALAEYEVAAREYAGQAEFEFRFGLACFRAGQTDRAREHLTLVVKKAPGTTDAARAEELLKLID